jgi:hypothetical protein
MSGSGGLRICLRVQSTVEGEEQTDSVSLALESLEDCSEKRVGLDDCGSAGLDRRLEG